MGENICKQCDWQGINLQNIQTLVYYTYVYLYNKLMYIEYMYIYSHEKMLNITNYQRNKNRNYSEVSLHITQNQNGHHQKIYKQ